MQALQSCIIAGSNNDYGMMYEYDEEDLLDTRQAVIDEIDRIQRMDQWLPSYQNIISCTALQIKKELILNRLQESDLTEFLAYTRYGTLDKLRLTAFSCLVELGALRSKHMLLYICQTIGDDPSPYVRKMLLATFMKGLGVIALGQERRPKLQNVSEEVVVQEAVVRSADNGNDGLMSSLSQFRSEFGAYEAFKEALWRATT